MPTTATQRPHGGLLGAVAGSSLSRCSGRRGDHRSARRRAGRCGLRVLPAGRSRAGQCRGVDEVAVGRFGIDNTARGGGVVSRIRNSRRGLTLRVDLVRRGRCGVVAGQRRHAGVLQLGLVSGSGVFLQTDPIPGGSANAYDYADQDPIDKFDLAGTCAHGFGWACSSWKAVKKHVKAPAYVGGCFGGGFWGGGQVCVDVTRAGHIYVTPSAGFETPGFSGGLHAGYIHGGVPTDDATDKYLHGWSAQGGGGFGAGASGVWGDEGKLNKSAWGYEGGIYSPGASATQGYGFRMPFNLPSW
jgi:hypothetical protein